MCILPPALLAHPEIGKKDHAAALAELAEEPAAPGSMSLQGQVHIRGSPGHCCSPFEANVL